MTKISTRYILFLGFNFLVFALYSQPDKRLDRSNLNVRNIKELNRSKEVIDKEPAITSDSTKAVQVKANCQNPASENYNNKYRQISTYIPQKGEKIKYININFNIFQDFDGNNNFTPSTNPQDSVRLLNMFAWINEIYARQPWCEESQSYNSDPPAGVQVNDLPHKYIQFKLKGIYEYRDKTPAEGLWKSNNSRDLLKRIAETDSSRLEQLNICFTEKHYLGSIREINVLHGGKNYMHPEVIIKGNTGKDARAYASVLDGKIKAIDVLNAGSNYKEAPEVIIKGGGGTGAKAIAHINEKTGGLHFIEVIHGGDGYKFSKVDIQGGGGYGSLAYVDKIKKGRIKSIYVAQRGQGFYDDPDIKIITDSKGEGASFNSVIRGATGFTLTPNFSNTDIYIVEKSLYNNGNAAGDYAVTTNIAHELGHTLDLLHTYSGGSETRNISHHDYLWDIFGKVFTTYHTIVWGKNPCESSTDLVSNNLMGGNQVSEYTSPLQIGKMHRALHIYNMKRYTDCNCDLNKSWLITENETWDFPFKSYNPIVVKSGASLTIYCSLEMPDGCDITVENGASLTIEKSGVITGGCNKKWNGKILIKKGADFIVKPGGSYLLEDLSKLIIE